MATFEHPGAELPHSPGGATETVASCAHGDGATHFSSKLYEFDNLEAMASLEQTWKQLASGSSIYSQCMTYEYCATAAETVFAESGSVAVAVVYSGRDVIALWAVAVRRKPFFTIAHALSCGSGEEYGGPMLSGPATADLVAYCVQAISKINADILDIPWVEDGSILHSAIIAFPEPWLVRVLPRKLTGHPAFGGNPGFMIDHSNAPKWEDYLNALPGGRRRNHRRLLKQLQQLGRTEIGWCKTPAECDVVIDWYFTYKRQWAAERGITTHYLSNDTLKEFFSRFARKIDLNTYPLVAFIKVDDVPVAASINLQDSRHLEYFMTTYDEKFSRYAVGIAMLVFLAELAHQRRLVFDMRYSYEPYKETWSNQQSYYRVHRIYLTPSQFKIACIVFAYAAARLLNLVRRELSKLMRRAAQRGPVNTYRPG